VTAPGQREGGEAGRRPAVAVAAALAVAAGVALAAALLSGGDPDGGPDRRPTRPAEPARPAPPAGPAVGVSVNRLFNERAYTPAQIDVLLAAARADGVRVARSDAFWSAAEPQPPAGGVHRYDWTFHDGVAGALAEHGIRWLAILDYAAPWAASVPGNDHSAPTASADYAAYAAAFARRFGRGGQFWRMRPELPETPVTTFEIWNEPDSPGFWAPAPDPARYAELYATARDAIRRVDPRARVIVGGLTNVAAFLPQLVAARPSLREEVDGIGIHPYATTPLGVLGVVRAARRVADAAGLDGVPLDVTEFGWVASPAGNQAYAPPGRRPRYVREATDALARSDCEIATVVLYTWVSPERDPADGEDWFGIRHPDGRPSPSSIAFARALAAAARPDRPIVRLCGP
jgi:hypothetical protein